MRPASELTDAELVSEEYRLGILWDSIRDDDEGHGGSPGEWVYERLDEIEAEQKRRATWRLGDHATSCGGRG